jgi:hypothetical protein
MIGFLILVAVVLVIGFYLQAKFGLLKAKTVAKVDAAAQDVVTKIEDKVQGK